MNIIIAREARTKSAQALFGDFIEKLNDKINSAANAGDFSITLYETFPLYLHQYFEELGYTIELCPDSDDPDYHFTISW